MAREAFTKWLSAKRQALVPAAAIAVFVAMYIIHVTVVLQTPTADTAAPRGTASRAQVEQVRSIVANTQDLIQEALSNCLKQPAGRQVGSRAVPIPLTFTGPLAAAHAGAAANPAVAAAQAQIATSASAFVLPAATPGTPPIVHTDHVGSALVEFKGYKLQLVALKNDEHVGAWILRERQPYEPGYLSVIWDYITPGSVVVDAGANMGSYATFFAAKTGEKGAVYAFEPQKRMHQVLVTNMMINGLMWLQPINAALSYEKGVLHMQGEVTHGTSVGQSYADADKQHKGINYGGQRLGAGGEEVQAGTLDSYNLRGVSLIKVDVQWAEKLVLYGARDTIKHNLPVVCYELPDANYLSQLEAEVQMPEEVRQFDYHKFLLELGYTELDHKGLVSDKVMLPPKQGNGRTKPRKSGIR